MTEPTPSPTGQFEIDMVSYGLREYLRDEAIRRLHHDGMTPGGADHEVCRPKIRSLGRYRR